jgi:ribonuclease P protein component
MLPKNHRLRQKRDFKRVYQRGKSLALPCFVLYWHKNRENDARIGFSVSKKIGKAVTRNHLKRQCRAIAKEYLSKFPPGYDYIFILRTAAATADYAELSKQLVQALQKLGQRNHNQATKQV